jgi:hypothetical protein
MASRKRREQSEGLTFSLPPAAKRALVGVLIVSVIGGVALFFVLRARGRSTVLAGHESKLTEYLRAGGAPCEGEPYVRGKVVTVDRTLKEIDPLFLDLPGSLCAQSPEEVGAVVLLDWQMKDAGWIVTRNRSGKETHKSKFYEHLCDITVVDRVTGCVSARATVTNRNDPDKRLMADVMTGKPTPQVLSFLNSLPRK